MSVLGSLYDAHISIAGHPITWREILGNGFGFASAVGGLRRKVWAWPVGIVGNVLLFTVFIAATFDADAQVPLFGQAGRHAAAFVDFFAGAADVLVESDFIDPCPIGTVAREVASTNELVRAAAEAAFDSWIRAATDILMGAGIERPHAVDLATLFVTTTEGCFVLCRTKRSTEPLAAVARLVTPLVSSAVEQGHRAPTVVARSRSEDGRSVPVLVLLALRLAVTRAVPSGFGGWVGGGWVRGDGERAVADCKGHGRAGGNGSGRLDVGHGARQIGSARGDRGHRVQAGGRQRGAGLGFGATEVGRRIDRHHVGCRGGGCRDRRLRNARGAR